MTEPANRDASCPDCGVDREWVDEPMISGFRGYLCLNDDCARDS